MAESLKVSDLVTRLRAYDKRNHRGQYAKLCHEAADALEQEHGYVERLRTCIGDLLAVGRARFGWGDIWKQRIENATKLLRRRRG